MRSSRIQMEFQGKENSSEKTKHYLEFLQSQSESICKEIESNMPVFQKDSIKMSNRNSYQHLPQSSSPSPTAAPPEYLSIMRERLKQKKEINEYKLKIEAIEVIDNITSMETALKRKADHFNSLLFENNTLQSIKRHQLKVEFKDSSKSISRDELVAMRERIRGIQEEIKVNRDYNQTLASRVKSQESQMTVIEKKCQIIKENIEYSQKQQIKLYANDRGEEEQKDYDKYHQPEFFHQQAMINERLLLNEENDYKRRVKSQKERIDQIEKEIKVLSSQISQIDYRAYIYEWEIKKKQMINEMNGKGKKGNAKVSLSNSMNRALNDNFNKPIAIKECYNQKPFAIKKGLNTNHNTPTMNTGNNSNWLISEIETLKKDIKRTLGVIDRVNPQFTINTNEDHSKADKAHDGNVNEDNYEDEYEEEEINNNKRKILAKVSQDAIFYPSKEIKEEEEEIPEFIS